MMLQLLILGGAVSEIGNLRTSAGQKARDYKMQKTGLLAQVEQHRKAAQGAASRASRFQQANVDVSRRLDTASASLTAREQELIKVKRDYGDLGQVYKDQESVNIELNTKVKQAESDLSSANKTLKVQTDELSTTKSRLSQVEHEASQIDQERGRLEAKAQSGQDAFEKLGRDLQARNNDLLASQQEVKALKQRGVDKQVLDQAIDKNKKLEDEYAQLELVHGNANLENEQKQVKINSLRAEMTTYKADIDKLRSTETELEATVAQQKELIDQTTTELTEAQQATLKGASKIDDLEHGRWQMEDDIQKLESKLQKETGVSRQYKTDLERTESDLSALKAELLQKGGASDATVKRLRDEISKKAALYEQLKAQLGPMRTELDTERDAKKRLGEEHTRLGQLHGQLVSDHKTTKESLRKVQTQADDWRDQVTGLRGEKSKMIDEHSAEITREVNLAHQRGLQQQQGNLQNVQSELDQARQQGMRLQSEHGVLKQHYTSIGLEHEGLKTKQQQLRGEYDALHTRATQLQSEHDALKGKYRGVEQLQQEHDSLKGKYKGAAKLQQEHDALKGRYETAQTRIGEMQQAGTALQAKYASTEAKVAKMQGAGTAIQAERDALKEAGKQLKIDINARDAHIVQLEQRRAQDVKTVRDEAQKHIDIMKAQMNQTVSQAGAKVQQMQQGYEQAVQTGVKRHIDEAKRRLDGANNAAVKAQTDLSQFTQAVFRIIDPAKMTMAQQGAALRKFLQTGGFEQGVAFQKLSETQARLAKTESELHQLREDVAAGPSLVGAKEHTKMLEQTLGSFEPHEMRAYDYLTRMELGPEKMSLRNRIDDPKHTAAERAEAKLDIANALHKWDGSLPMDPRIRGEIHTALRKTFGGPKESDLSDRDNGILRDHVFEPFEKLINERVSSAEAALQTTNLHGWTKTSPGQLQAVYRLHFVNNKDKKNQRRKRCVFTVSVNFRNWATVLIFFQ